MNVHFIGIGGISMSGLAAICLNLGYNVSGSDSTKSYITEKLASNGAKIFIGQSASNIDASYDLVVYTAAIRPDNEELIKSRACNIKTVDRACFLGSLMEKYANSIAISGTHGKTSTTSMISTIYNYSDLDPTILVGGNLPGINGNVKIGNSDYFITEACEYVDSFLSFFPKYAIILNIEADHLDYFKDIDHIIESFGTFAANVKSNGKIIANGDDISVKKALSSFSNVLYFGTNNDNDYVISNIALKNDFSSFEISSKEKNLGTFTIQTHGIHNIFNSASAIICAHVDGLNLENIRKAIYSYAGVGRRFEFKGEKSGIRIYDDYAHHPSEIKATLAATKPLDKKRLFAIFQPHTFSRTHLLLDDFAKSFTDCDFVIIADIYASREKDTGLIHALDLVNKIKLHHNNVYYFATFEEISDFLIGKLENYDIVLTMGAGNINALADKLLNSL
ncbi:MAG: UDP-N-acetylmuramate--L-alanine ligase [Proteocatella sp.]